MIDRSYKIALMMVCLLCLQSHRLRAADAEGLKFYSRLGNQSLSGETLRLLSDPSGPSPTPLTHPLDVQAGMNYEQGSYQMQFGSRYELGSSSGLLLDQRVHVEGGIRIRW